MSHASDGYAFLSVDHENRLGITQIAKWGNSLALRLPADLVRERGLKEGDQIDLRNAGLRSKSPDIRAPRTFSRICTGSGGGFLRPDAGCLSRDAAHGR